MLLVKSEDDGYLKLNVSMYIQRITKIRNKYFLSSIIFFDHIRAV